MNNTLFLRIDWITLGLYAALVYIGFINIYSATYDENAAFWNLTNPITKQLLFGITGLLGGILLLYVNGKFFGAENGELAKTILCVMLKSVAGKYCDIICMAPVVNITAYKLSNLEEHGT